MQLDYYMWQGKTLIFNVFLQPRASRNILVGLHDNAIKIALTALPVDGEANKQLIRFLSKLFRVKNPLLPSSWASTVGVNVSACASHHSSHQNFLNNHLYSSKRLRKKRLIN